VEKIEQTEKETDYFLFDEFKTLFLMKEMFDNVLEHQVKDLFDLFENKTTRKISII